MAAMSLRRELQKAEAEGRAEAHQTDRNVRIFTVGNSPYWGVVYDWAFADEWKKMKADHDRLHGKGLS
jgi:hypothetical protein